jgi:hypothetical protein
MTTVIQQLVFLIPSIVLTALVAWTMQRNGRLFLIDAFQGNTELAHSVNRSLILGFCLVMLGDIAVVDMTPMMTFPDLWLTTQAACTRTGWVLLFLGLMYFCNLFLLTRMGNSYRNRSRERRNGESLLA